MKPTDEAVMRWWRWRYGYHREVPSVEQMWKDFHTWRELERDGGGLTYKQMYYEKIQEIAEEQYEKMTALETAVGEWTEIKNLETGDDVNYNRGMRDALARCIKDVDRILKGE